MYSRLSCLLLGVYVYSTCSTLHYNKYLMTTREWKTAQQQQSSRVIHHVHIRLENVYDACTNHVSFMRGKKIFLSFTKTFDICS